MYKYCSIQTGGTEAPSVGCTESFTLNSLQNSCPMLLIHEIHTTKEQHQQTLLSLNSYKCCYSKEKKWNNPSYYINIPNSVCWESQVPMQYCLIIQGAVKSTNTPQTGKNFLHFMPFQKLYCSHPKWKLCGKLGKNFTMLILRILMQCFHRDANTISQKNMYQ